MMISMNHNMPCYIKAVAIGMLAGITLACSCKCIYKQMMPPSSQMRKKISHAMRSVSSIIDSVGSMLK